MAEIKSAVELAMERTKGLRLHEEKEKIKEEEIHSRAAGLANRYLEVDFHLREVEKELARVDPTQRPHLEKLFLQNLAEALDLDRDNDLILQGLETFRPACAGALQTVRALIREYQDRKKEEFRNTETDLSAKLERLGIGGPAVVPRVEGSPEWEQAKAGFKPEAEEELKKLKKEIRPYLEG